MALTRKCKIFLVWWYRRKYLTTHRRYWIHPMCRDGKERGEFKLLPQIFSDDEKCMDYLRMSKNTFDFLLTACSPLLKKQDTNCRKAIPSVERLVVTLRYLATGNSFKSLSFSFRLGVCTVQRIVRSTCKILWETLHQTFLPFPNAELWTETSEGFFSRWQFPNCVGAIDGKHIRIKKPVRSGSMYWNYKGFCSVVLLAVGDAHGRLLIVDIGSYGSCSDGGIFNESQFGKLLAAHKLNLPNPAKIPHTDITIPHLFVADEAFPLMPSLMKPFARRNISFEKVVCPLRN